MAKTVIFLYEPGPHGTASRPDVVVTTIAADIEAPWRDRYLAGPPKAPA